MSEEGWKPVEARQLGVRRMERCGFQRHMVRFQRRDLVAEVGEFAPEVILPENLLRGGMRDSTKANRAGKPFHAMRAIRGLGANVAINLGIWEIAESFRQD